MVSALVMKDGEQQIRAQVAGGAVRYSQTGLAAGQAYTATIAGEVDGRAGAAHSVTFSTPVSVVYGEWVNLVMVTASLRAQTEGLLLLLPGQRRPSGHRLRVCSSFYQVSASLRHRLRSAPPLPGQWRPSGHRLRVCSSFYQVTLWACSRPAVDLPGDGGGVRLAPASPVWE
ncbi:unnamed protein product [Boreogadus saida]